MIQKEPMKIELRLSKRIIVEILQIRMNEMLRTNQEIQGISWC